MLFTPRLNEVKVEHPDVVHQECVANQDHQERLEPYSGKNLLSGHHQAK